MVLCLYVMLLKKFKLTILMRFLYYYVIQYCQKYIAVIHHLLYVIQSFTSIKSILINTNALFIHLDLRRFKIGTLKKIVCFLTVLLRRKNTLYRSSRITQEPRCSIICFIDENSKGK